MLNPISHNPPDAALAEAMAQPRPRYASIDAFCDLSGLGRSNVYQRLSGGDFLAVKVGRKTLIDVDHALNWIASQPRAAIRIRRHAGAGQRQ